MIQLLTPPARNIRCTEFKLVRGDCVAGMAKLPADSVDVVVTSPPYNLGIKYGKYDDHQVRDEYLEWSLEWASQVQRVLKEKGSFFLNVGGAPSNPLLPHQLILVMCKLFTLQNTFHWIKSITVETRAGEQISVGHFKPISSHRFVTDCHEYVFHLTKTGNTPVDRLAIGVPYADKSNIKRWAHTGGGISGVAGIIGSCLTRRFGAARSSGRIRRRSRWNWRSNASSCTGAEPGLVVMDPFLGIGHSAVAARNCGVARFIGFEIDGEYLRRRGRWWRVRS